MRCGDYPRLCKWAQSNHLSFLKWKRKPEVGQRDETEEEEEILEVLERIYPVVAGFEMEAGKPQERNEGGL